MKKLFIIAFCALSALSASAQAQLSNRYGMKLKQNADSSYSLINAKKYARMGANVDALPDVLKPYTYKRERLNSRDYKGVETINVVYKRENGYELSLAIDRAATTGKAPVMFYVHGGGWARGTNDSSRPMSQYLAKQHGITGVRVQYTLAPQPGASVEVSVADMRDAVEYVRMHADELGVDMTRFGFLGTSAGGHLAAVAAMSIKGAKVFVGYSGIYDLTTAGLVVRSKDPQRLNYFKQLDQKVLRSNSPIDLIPSKNIPACMIVCGTYDATVEHQQSEEFAKALEKKGATVVLNEYKGYDHNLSSKASDKMEEIFFNTVDFVVKYLK